MRFRDLTIGQFFDWVDDSKPGFNSFFLRCIKASSRTYIDSTGSRHRVGSVNAKVFHVGKES